MCDAQVKIGGVGELALKLYWPSVDDAPDGDCCLILELQDMTGQSIASLSAPKDQLMEALVCHLNHEPMLSLDGKLSFAMVEHLDMRSNGKPITLVDLIARAVSPDMLEDEPEATQLLSKFRSHLLESLKLVQEAIASLPKR